MVVAAGISKAWAMHRQTSILPKGVAWRTAFDKLFPSPVVTIILYLGKVHSLLKKKKIPKLTCRAASAALNHRIQPIHDVETQAPNLSVLLRSSIEEKSFWETTEGELGARGAH